MDSTSDADPAEALLALTRQIRAQLERHAGQGAWAAPAAPTPQLARGTLAEAPISELPSGFPPAATFPSAAVDIAVDIAIDHTVDRAVDIAVDRTVDGAVDIALDGAVDRAVDAGVIVDEVVDVDVDGAPLVQLVRRSLVDVRAELGNCTRCKLAPTRKSIVFGIGAEDSPIVFVGEAPGEQEDLRGEPFVGRAGELLDKMIEAMGWTRASVYIANVLKCRPPGNRNPQPDEVAACSPFLDAQLRAIAPRIIVTLGRPAANHVLGNDAPISTLRGRWHDRAGVRVMPTFHPAYLLRDPDKKREAWADLKLVMAELDRLGIAPPSRN